MKHIKLLLTTALLANALLAFGQLITPESGNETKCPDVVNTYTANQGGNYSNCSEYVWTVTNGSFSSSSSVTSKTTTEPDIDVYWKNVAANGTLSATVTGCDVDGETEKGGFTVSDTYAIRSLTGRTPTNAMASQNLSYCSTNNVILSVDEMTLNNTGGSTGIQLQYADGYEWNLPPGWKSGGSADGATIRTSENFISIFPTHGCSAGTATVRAYVNCGSGRKNSNKANIVLSRVTPNVSISFPSGYSGPSCGDKQLRTFTVTPVSCAANYTWIFPSGWRHSDFTTTTNTITVTPSGGSSDGGTIRVNVNLICESVFPASKNINYNPPVIVSPTEVCSGGTAVSLTNIPSSYNVQWSVSSRLLVFSGQGTTNIVAKPSSNSRGVGTINATVTECPNTSIATDTTWVNEPTPPGTISGPTSPNVGHTELYTASNPGPGATSHVWVLPKNGKFDLYKWKINRYNLRPLSVYLDVGTNPGYVQLIGQNACGNGGARLLYVTPTGAGGCDPCQIVFADPYPNPAQNDLYVEHNLARADSLKNVNRMNGLVHSLGNRFEKEVSYSFYDKDGNLALFYSNNDLTTQLDISSLENGIYILIIQYSKNLIEEHRIIVDK